MPIHILDSETIDKIAAGEVVERPASVVKELVENAIDAGATAITVEAKDGGIEFIRVTDNGSGIDRTQLRTAFLRHATSKIEKAGDLTHIASLGFRGEALSSIAAVSKVEIITKQRQDLTGVRMVLEGGIEQSMDEVGAPDGTTFLMRNLFYNTPVRRKFLKQPATEGGYIADLMEHLALSRPDISFKFILGNQTRFHTSGNGDLKEVIYRIYGRDIASSLVPIQLEQEGICIEGYLGKPMLVRSNRNFEIYYINGRFIRSSVIAKAVEEGYKEYLMQHKFPFCVLHITMDTERVDVNVHPTKMDVRFSDALAFSSLVGQAVRTTLKNREMIPDAVLGEKEKVKQSMQQEKNTSRKEHGPEPFEPKREATYRLMEETRYAAERLPRQEFLQKPVWSAAAIQQELSAGLPKEEKEPVSEKTTKAVEEEPFFLEPEAPQTNEGVEDPVPVQKAAKQEMPLPSGEQMNLFEERLLSVENRSRYQIIGQIFYTYWLVQFEDRLLIIDQHAAHEKVKYERLMKQYREKSVVSQTLMPPVIVTLTGQEETVLKEYLEVFAGLGFEVEAFGGSEYALRSVPTDLYGCSEKEMFLEVLDELSEGIARNGFKVVEEKIASMSCKAAVKGNNKLSRTEAQRLIDELLTLENPYNCPHGRPTMITMSQTELEKKFKRIV